MDFESAQHNRVVVLERREVIVIAASTTTPLCQSLVFARIGHSLLTALLLFLLFLFLGVGFLFAGTTIVVAIIIVIIALVVVIIKIRILETNGTGGHRNAQNAIKFGHSLGFVHFVGSLIVEDLVLEHLGRHRRGTCGCRRKLHATAHLEACCCCCCCFVFFSIYYYTRAQQIETQQRKTTLWLSSYRSNKRWPNKEGIYLNNIFTTMTTTTNNKHQASSKQQTPTTNNKQTEGACLILARI